MIAPLALLGLLILPVIVAFYMLRLRRRDVPIGSTFLWQQLIHDVEANAPWQRLRFSWLLLLQLLIALALVVAAARPFTQAPSALAANVVLIVDTSASMGATDADGPRIELAREAARGIIDELPQGGRVTVVAADATANVLVSETDERSQALDALDAISATQLPGDLTDAFALASALAARDADSTVVVVTDAGGDDLPAVGIGAPIRVVRVGSSDANQAVAALSVARRSGGAQLEAFVAVSNPSGAEVTRRLELYADDALVDARELTIPAGRRAEAIVASVPADAQVVEARLAGEDALATDDRAVALVPSDAPVRTLIVSAGNTYLEQAFALLPRLEVYAVAPDAYADALDEAETAGTPYGLVVFDRWQPATPPDAAALYVAPDADGPWGVAGEAIDAPAIGATRADEPVLRYVDLSTVHIGRARELTLATGMRPIVATPAGSPLLGIGRVAGQPTAVLAFALGESDLPLQVAFPLLVSNLADALVPAAGGLLPASAALGTPIALSLDPALPSVTVRDGASSQLVPLSGGRGTLPGAQRIGIREVIDPDGTLIGRVAANLFSAGESDIAPGDPERIVEMGRVSAGAGDDGTTRAEWWWPIALAVLGLLLIEWLLFHRPTRRSLARVLRRSAGAAPSVRGGAKP
jgi:hypothetical protein